MCVEIITNVDDADVALVTCKKDESTAEQVKHHLNKWKQLVRLECPASHLPPSPRRGEGPAGDIRHSKETAASLSSNQDFTRLVSVCVCTCIHDNC